MWSLDQGISSIWKAVRNAFLGPIPVLLNQKMGRAQQSVLSNPDKTPGDSDGLQFEKQKRCVLVNVTNNLKRVLNRNN